MTHLVLEGFHEVVGKEPVVGGDAEHVVRQPHLQLAGDGRLRQDGAEHDGDEVQPKVHQRRAHGQNRFVGGRGEAHQRPVGGLVLELATDAAPADEHLVVEGEESGRGFAQRVVARSDDGRRMSERVVEYPEQVPEAVLLRAGVVDSRHERDPVELRDVVGGGHGQGDSVVVDES